MTVDSCGTLDHDGHPSPRDAVRAGRALGIDLEGHRSRGLGSCDLGSSDLVVGFELTHVARAVVDGGARRETAFTLPELVRLLENASDLPRAGEQRARAAVEAAHGARDGYAHFVPGEDIADPIGAPYEFHLRTGQTIKTLSERLAAHLFGHASLDLQVK